MKPLFFASLCFVLGLASTESRASGPFRLHLSTEPQNLDPQKQRSTASSYLLQNLHRGLFIFDDEGGLTPDLAESSCTRPQKKLVRCRLRANLKWSDGSPLTAGDFVRAWRRLADPSVMAPRADLAFALRNGREIRDGKEPLTSLGVRAKDSRTIEFDLAEPTPDFEWSLATTLTAPIPEVLPKRETWVGSGPYKIDAWESGKRVRLSANPHYPRGRAERPPVEMFFIDEDSTALRLYQKNELDFLRRLPTLYIPRYRRKPEFHWVPVTRLDYLGFGPRLKDQPALRQALTRSLDYKGLQALFHSDGVPGCPGLPESWLPPGAKMPCYERDLAEAKKLVKDSGWKESLRMSYSTQGGEDHRRAAELEQANWRQAGLNVGVRGLENKIFLEDLRERTPDIYRKGLAVDRPTCLAALERFRSTDPENYARIENPELDRVIGDLEREPSAKKKQELCLKGLQLLMNKFAIIPLGRMHFAILASPRFAGWRLNQLNQLFLENLETRSGQN